MTTYDAHLAALAERRTRARTTPTAALRCPHCHGPVWSGRGWGTARCGPGGWVYWCTNRCAESFGRPYRKERCLP